jgi:hypothetical protein
MSRLMDGSLQVLATVLMWPVGIMAAFALLPGLSADRPIIHSSPLSLWTALLGLWVLREVALLARSLRRAGSVRRFVGAPIYSISAGAALVGGANTVLLMATGPWSFTGTLLCAMKAETVARCDASLATPLLVLAAALSGMALSSWQRKSFHLQRPRPRLMLRHAAGGLLKGFGAVLIPGGNDGLILFGVPSQSPHAIPAYAGVLAGVATALLTLRALGRTVAPVICVDDICRTQL